MAAAALLLGSHGVLPGDDQGADSADWTQAAGLKWNPMKVEVPAELFQESAEARFKFHNDSDQPVEILSIRTDCGCTTAMLEERVVPPNGYGEIRVVFTFEERTGLQERITRVATDADPESADLLLTTRIPAPLLVTPDLLQWQPEEGGEQRSVELVNQTKLNIKEVNILSREDWISTRVEEVEPGRKFRIQIDPDPVEDQVAVSLGVQVQFEDGQEAVAPVYLLFLGSSP